MKFIILLHKVVYDYVTLFDVYECAIDPELLEKRIAEAEQRFLGAPFLFLSPEVYAEHVTELKDLAFQFDSELNLYKVRETDDIRDTLGKLAVEVVAGPKIEKTSSEVRKVDQLGAVKRWFYNDWRRIEPKLRTSIVEGISVFLSLFDDNPDVKRTFCPPKECYDVKANAHFQFGKPLPSFGWLIEEGAVCALNFPIGMNAGLARALGVMLKLDFQRAVLNRVPKMEAHPERKFRQVFFICDEYQHFATVGENEPTEDEKFFSLSRQQSASQSSRRKASAHSGLLFPEKVGGPCSKPLGQRYSWRCGTTSQLEPQVNFAAKRTPSRLATTYRRAGTMQT